jgi:hypothetical protein
LVRYNTAQLAHFSSAAPAACHQLYDEALMSSSFDNLTAAAECFQRDLTRAIDYNLYAMSLGIAMILAATCMALDRPLIMLITCRIGHLAVGLVLLLIAGGHSLVCGSETAASASLLCSISWVPSLAILLLGSGCIVSAVLYAATSWRLDTLANGFHAFRDLFSFL